MACSDNVIRAGLTPKHIDVPTLVDMLDYNSYGKDQLLFHPQLEDANSCIWRPPVPDFAVVKINVCILLCVLHIQNSFEMHTIFSIYLSNNYYYQWLESRGLVT